MSTVDTRDKASGPIPNAHLNQSPLLYIHTHGPVLCALSNHNLTARLGIIGEL